MIKYTETISFMVSKEQKSVLDSLRENNIRVSNFIREAIAEKINREAEELKEKPKESYCPW